MANTGDVEMVKPADCGENHDDMETDEVEETNTDEQRYWRFISGLCFHEDIWRQNSWLLDIYRHRLALAEDKKKQGNSQYSQKHYEEAVRLYSEAIGTSLQPETADFSKVLGLKFFDVIKIPHVM